LAPATWLRIKNGRRAFGDRFLAPYDFNGSGLTGRSIHRPVGTITTRDRWSVVDDNRMRMLNVDECKAAMGFRSSYQLPEQSRLAKHMLGNAVPPPTVTAIIEEISA
jgi:DNA (cytosine-5)-methyltransferase 1